MAVRHSRPAGVTAAVAASFPNMGAARRAIEALEHAGVDGDDIDLLGRGADAARTPTSPGRPDRRVARHVVRRLGLGAIIGAVAGAAAGLVLGLVVLAATSTGGGAALVAAFVIVGVGLGAVVSTFLSFERSVSFSEAWPLTFEDAPDGVVWVAVYSRDRRTRERADEALARQTPLELRRDAGPG
jgi:hypothetical protein